MIRQTAALVRAQFIEIRRSKTALFWMTAFPLGFLLLFGFAGWRQAKFFLQAPPLLGGAAEAEDGFGEMRVAGKGAVWRRHGRARIEPEKIAIGFIGVEHAPGMVGDQGALRQVVDKGSGQVVAGLPSAEMQDADRAGEQAEHPDHGKAAEDGQHERLGHLARDHGKPDRGGGERKREQDDETDAAFALGTVGGGRCIAHGRVDISHDLAK